MLRWLTPYYVRILCDCPFNGGFGFTPAEVGDMTIDQIMMLLVDRNHLRKTAEGYVRQFIGAEAVALADKDGFIPGVDKDGKPIKARIAGKSLARQIMERKQKEKEEKERNAPPKLSPREIRQQRRREQEEAQKAKRK